VNVRELLRFELEGLSVHLPPHKRILSYDVSFTPLARTTIGKLRRHEIERAVRDRTETSGVADARPLSSADHAWLSAPGRAATIHAIAGMLKRDAVHPDANLELDLGLDSMERVELLTMLEQRARATVPASARASILSVRQLVEAIEGATPRIGNDADRREPGWDAILAEPPDSKLLERLDRWRWFRALLFFLVIRIARGGARLLFGFQPRGAAHIPRDSGVIITPNHQSFLDGFAVASALPVHALRRIFFVGAAEYYQTRGSRWLAGLANIVPVDPDANLVAALQVSAAGLRSGHVLVLFPEGERTIDGEVKTFRKGAAILASHLHVPIIPAALDGLYAIWPRSRPIDWRRLLPGRAPRVSLVFDTPFLARPGAYAEDATALQNRVQRLVRGLRNNDPASP
jgi:long-chain acyl-CoA synthetase